jgi:hypothetical protein
LCFPIFGVSFFFYSFYTHFVRIQLCLFPHVSIAQFLARAFAKRKKKGKKKICFVCVSGTIYDPSVRPIEKPLPTSRTAGGNKGKEIYA